MIDILQTLALLMMWAWLWVLSRATSNVSKALHKPEPHVGVWAKLVGGPCNGKHVEVNLLRLPAKHMVPIGINGKVEHFDKGDIITAGAVQFGWDEYHRDKTLTLGGPIEYLYMGTDE